MIEAQPLTKEKVGNVRADLGWSQNDLAKRASVSKTTVFRAETGQVILRLKARAIWNALNRGRGEQGLDALPFDDLDWNLRD